MQVNGSVTERSRYTDVLGWVPFRRSDCPWVGPSYALSTTRSGTEDEPLGSILLWLQDRCCEAIALVVSRFSDDPEALVLGGRVSTQEAAAVDQCGIVQLAVFMVEVAPVAGEMPYEKLVGRLSGIPDGIEGTWCCDDLAGVKFQ